MLVGLSRERMPAYTTGVYFLRKGEFLLMTATSTLLLGLLVATLIFASLATRLRVPYAILLVLGGALLSLVPALPEIDLDPEVILFLFLPSYSPDFSPIEEAFSKLKAFLRRMEARTPESLQEAIGQALLTITAQDAQGWFRHCGYSTDSR
jgi:hypothetical protein